MWREAHPGLEIPLIFLSAIHEFKATAGIEVQDIRMANVSESDSRITEDERQLACPVYTEAKRDNLWFLGEL